MKTNNEIRGAILLAADYIEARPHEFNFLRSEIPDGCGTVGCAMGWIGHFLGLKHNPRIRGVDRVGFVMGLEEDAPYPLDREGLFYFRMCELCAPEIKEAYYSVAGWKWSHDAQSCARVLRLYANRYHPEESLVQAPEYRTAHAA